MSPSSLNQGFVSSSARFVLRNPLLAPHVCGARDTLLTDASITAYRKRTQSITSCIAEHHNPGNADSPSPASVEKDEPIFDGLSFPVEALEWRSSKLHPLNNPSPLDPHSRKSEQQSEPVDSDLISGRISKAFVDTFRMSSPYISAHRGRLFVIHIPAPLLEEKLFTTVIEDIALMNVVGIELVLVLGPEAQIDGLLKREGSQGNYVNDTIITDLPTLRIVKEAAGIMRFEVESALSRGVRNMPRASSINFVSGCFYSAQPVGIIDGQDFEYSGKVRRVDVDTINRRLRDGDIVIIPNIGFSPSGQTFNCRSEEVAGECAGQLQAQKLIFMGEGESLVDKRLDHSISNISLKSASQFLEKRAQELPANFRKSLQCSVSALKKGAHRAHLVNRFVNGVLLIEVFHRDGVGLMVSRDLYEGLRRARLSDLSGVQDIIRPLEEQGILKRRSRHTLEGDLVPDNPLWAELGCLAVHADYRKLGKGDAMLRFTERMAYNMGIRNLFILSTQSFEWFRERGFSESHISDLPSSKQELYDTSRKSKVFMKLLEGYNAFNEAELLDQL